MKRSLQKLSQSLAICIGIKAVLGRFVPTELGQIPQHDPPVVMGQPVSSIIMAQSLSHPPALGLPPLYPQPVPGHPGFIAYAPVHYLESPHMTMATAAPYMVPQAILDPSGAVLNQYFGPAPPSGGPMIQTEATPIAKNVPNPQAQPRHDLTLSPAAEPYVPKEKYGHPARKSMDPSFLHNSIRSEGPYTEAKGYQAESSQGSNSPAKSPTYFDFPGDWSQRTLPKNAEDTARKGKAPAQQSTGSIISSSTAESRTNSETQGISKGFPVAEVEEISRFRERLILARESLSRNRNTMRTSKKCVSLTPTEPVRILRRETNAKLVVPELPNSSGMAVKEIGKTEPKFRILKNPQAEKGKDPFGGDKQPEKKETHFDALELAGNQRKDFMDTTRKKWSKITPGNLGGEIYSEKCSRECAKDISGDKAEYPLNKYIEDENLKDQFSSQSEMSKHSDQNIIKVDKKINNDQHQETKALPVLEKMPSLENWQPRSPIEQHKHHSILNVNKEAQNSLNQDLNRYSELSSKDLERSSFDAKGLGPTSDVDKGKLKENFKNKDEDIKSAEDNPEEEPEEETEDKTAAMEIKKFKQNINQKSNQKGKRKPKRKKVKKQKSEKPSISSIVGEPQEDLKENKELDEEEKEEETKSHHDRKILEGIQKGEEGKYKDTPETSNVFKTSTRKNDGSLKEENVSGEDTPLVDVPDLERIMPAKEKSSQEKTNPEMKGGKDIYDHQVSIHSGASNTGENLGKSESILDDSEKTQGKKVVENILDKDEEKDSSSESKTIEEAEIQKSRLKALSYLLREFTKSTESLKQKLTLPVFNMVAGVSSSSSERFEIEGFRILKHLFEEDFFKRVFGHKTNGFPNHLLHMVLSLKTKKDVLNGNFAIKTQQQIQKFWGKKRILSWNKQHLDVDFMNHLSRYFRINEKDNHLGLESLQLSLFKMIIFFRKTDQFLIAKIYGFLGTELNEAEAFRRMLTLSKQCHQLLIDNIKEKLIYSPHTPPGLFENSKSGEYEKTFDYLGYYGINPERIITKELYPFYIRKNSDNTPGAVPFFSKYCIHVRIIGAKECRDRCSPRVNFPAENFSAFIEKSNYMNIIKSQDFIKALSSNGLSLNRVLSVVLILGLEEENWKLELAEEDVHYLGKVLYMKLFTHEFNHLPWIETSERHFLKTHYKEKYTTHLQILLSKLQSMSSTISQKSLPAVYTPNIYDHIGELDEVTSTDSMTEYWDKMDQVLKHFEYYIPQLEGLDQISSSNLSEKISQLEAHP